MTHPTIACSKCNGTGKTKLPDVLLEVLTIMHTEPRKMWLASDVHKHINPDGGFGVTAINNRLNLLHSHGLVSRTRSGNRWLFFLPKKG